MMDATPASASPTYQAGTVDKANSKSNAMLPKACSVHIGHAECSDASSPG